MAAWRRRANVLFPAWWRGGRGFGESPYFLFGYLQTQSLEAHRLGHIDFLKRAYAFAEFCSHSSATDLWNAAGVVFYEDIVIERDLWESVAQWICPDVKKEVEVLWDVHLNKADLTEFLRIWEIHKGRRAKETIFHTRNIFEL